MLTALLLTLLAASHASTFDILSANVDNVLEGPAPQPKLKGDYHQTAGRQLSEPSPSPAAEEAQLPPPSPPSAMCSEQCMDGTRTWNTGFCSWAPARHRPLLLVARRQMLPLRDLV